MAAVCKAFRGEVEGVEMAKTKASNAIDAHVGSRVRMRRMMLGMSQEKLGDALGLIGAGSCN